jgi:hypothetical protein
MKGLEVLKHIQESHEGPLVHYFKPRLALSLPLAFEQTAVLAITNDGNTFFLKVVHQPGASDSCGPDETLVWLLMLGSKQQADNYELVLNLNGHGDQGKCLSFRARALSLSSAPWTQTCKTGSGIGLTQSILRENFATELELGIPIKMEAEVKDTSLKQCLP